MERTMTKRIFLMVFAALAASGFIIICTLGHANQRRRTETKAAAAATEPEQPLYTVTEREGRAAVIRRGSDEPLRYIDIEVSLMPELDREQLRAGIGFGNEAELERYIQDITS
jgi:hypothetical protein